MLARALEAGVPARWVAADEVSGADPVLRAHLEAHGLGYVLGIGCDRRVSTAAGPRRPDALAASLPKGARQRLSAGRGAKGQRYYDWALITLTAKPGHHWLLIRRHPATASSRSTAATPHPSSRSVSWSALPDAAGPIEESFQAAKGLAGLDEHQLRRWLPWRRWTLLAMLAHALLAVIAATERAQHPPPRGLIALTCHKIHALFTTLITEPTRRLTNPLAWSHWRRHHQHQARLSHYRRQQTQLT